MSDTITSKPHILPSIGDVTTLEKLYKELFPILLFGKEKDLQYWQAEEVFFQTLYDRVASQRLFLRNQVLADVGKGLSLSQSAKKFTLTPILNRTFESPEEVVQFLSDEMQYPVVPQIVASSSDLMTLLAQYFSMMEHDLVTDTLKHNTLIWKVLSDGYEPVKQVFWQWLKDCDERHITSYSLTKAYKNSFSLNERMTRNEPLTEAEFAYWCQLLDDPSPLVAALAAQCLGLGYNDDVVSRPEWQPSLAVFLKDLQQRQYRGCTVLGGFLRGLLDTGTLYELEKREDIRAANFAVRTWVIETVLCAPDYEPYIHPTQSFWFYVHEYLDRDTAAIEQFIDGGRYFHALMCATESLNETFSLMKPLLERLVAIAPIDIAQSAAKALAQQTTS